MIFHWSLSDSKSLQVSRILLGILTDLSNARVWIVSTCPLISMSSRPLSLLLSFYSWESGDQHRENQEENKLLYPDCELVIQGLLTLSFWNRKHNQCLTCQTTCMVNHILIEFFAVIRKRFFKVTSLTDLFENVKIDDILSLRKTELYQKIWQLKTS